MEKEIILNNHKIEYNLERKKVKNINLRIKNNGKVYVSANRFVNQSVIENFLISKSDFILKAINKYQNIYSLPQTKFFDEEEIKEVILDLCKKVYPYFELKGISYPDIKFKKMVSRWGSCHVKRNILTFNINLMYAPLRCVEYVVFHEFTHFLVPNHSAKFYDELKKVCPMWSELRKELNNINIR